MSERNLTEKWLSGELSESELEDFKKQADYELNQRVLDAAQRFGVDHFSELRPFEEFKERFERSNEPKVRYLTSLKFISRIAAVLVLAIGIYFVFFNSPMTEINTLASQKKVFELPDASKVSVNSLSSVSYRGKNWEEKRILNLEGEAYFEVAKGSKFDVVTKDGTVSVLGTKFTVKQRKNYFEVQCYEGIVAIESGTHKDTLTQGKSFRIIDYHASLDSIGNSGPDWLDNRSTFKSVPLKFVLNELERQYGIEIKTENVDTNGLYSGGFDHSDIDTALESVTSPFNLTYKKEGSSSYRIE